MSSARHASLLLLLPALASCGESPPPTPESSLAATAPPPLAFGVQVFDTSGVGCSGEGPGCARVTLSFPEFQPSGSPALTEIRNWVAERVLDFPLEEPGDMPATPRDWVRAFLTAHERFAEGFPSAPGGWFIERHIRVLRNDGSVVALLLEESSYLGGAHPNTVMIHHNVDARTGRVLLLEDLVRDGSVDTLRERVSDAVRLSLGLQPGASLVQAGLMAELLPLPATFLLTGEGIQLHYNPYEVGPYVMGPIRGFLRWEALADLLQEPRRWIPDPPGTPSVTP